MKVFIGADYRGFDAKNALLDFLRSQNYDVVDEGAFEKVEGDDFNDPAIRVATNVQKEPGAFGILICDSAHGMTMQANRLKGIRAAHCGSVESALLAREHDDANILCLSAHFLAPDEMNSIADKFLTQKFEPLERRVRRIKRLDEETKND
ncbi:RpiB/LacA/LacB family sugar-phosphate isomerase [Candidatus Saccharibacteria bacterium]|nr:RpiB/LacA/LacB family sugar-phosphate isomerase [Candidatus Saccharibacteria bacterium]MBQ3263879.1 RpiB/LacA/LacB family sugar-phosphate isomerase [Candidatus Saccharibacteria bacterium]